MQPFDNRVRAWQRIARDLPMDKLEAMIQPATLGDLPKLGADILKGQVQRPGGGRRERLNGAARGAEASLMGIDLPHRGVHNPKLPLR